LGEAERRKLERMVSLRALATIGTSEMLWKLVSI